MSIAAIYLNTQKAGPMARVGAVRAEPGRGLEGNRYGRPDAADVKVGPDREVTLIELEAIEALRREEGLAFEPGESRRNLVTRGVPLNHLVGRTFRVGQAVLRGLRLCEPCGHLESLTRPGVRDGLVHRGGLRAEVLQPGEIREGDPVRAEE